MVVTIALAVQLMSTIWPNTSKKNFEKKIASLFDSGHVAERFEMMIAAQGGPKDFLSTYKNLLPKAQSQVPIFPVEDGFIKKIDTRKLGGLLTEIGGGRNRAEDKLDLSVGFSNVVKTNQKVDAEQPLLILHCSDQDLSSPIIDKIKSCFSIVEKNPEKKTTTVLEKIN